MANDPTSSGLSVAGRALPPEVLASIREASQKTGTDFAFLVAQARIESGFQGGVHAHARHSTAAGLFQFNAQTWMQMMRKHGAANGHGDLAQQITTQPNGKLGTGNPETDKQILDLRSDVKLSAIFAGELAKRNAAHLEKALGHGVGPADLHLAHLLGATGAVRFLKARQADAAQAAAAVVPNAARQNPNLFFARGNHTPHSVAAVYNNIQNRIAAPIRQVALKQTADRLRPGLGLSDAPPRPKTDGI